MAYSFNRSDGTAISVANDAIDNTYSLGLIGRNTVDYGLTMAKNTVLQLENFASSTPPSGTALTGQLWYNTTEETLRVYNGSTWKRATAIPVANTAPSADFVAGTAYFNTVNDQLEVYAESTWKPAVIPGGNITSALSAQAGIGSYYGAKVETIFLEPQSGDHKAVLALKYASDGSDNPGVDSSSNETVMAIISDHASFTLSNADPYYAELSNVNSIGVTIGKGLTLRADYSDSTVENANVATYASYADAININSAIPTSGGVVGAADIFVPAKDLKPSADSTWVIGNSTLRYSEIHGDTIYAGAGGAVGGGILFAGTACTIGNATQGASHIYTEDLTVSGNFNFGAGVQNIGGVGDEVENIYANNIFLTSGTITSVPSNNNDITNKTYVDTSITTSLANYVPNSGTKTVAGTTTFQNTTNFQDSISGTSGSFTGTVSANLFDGVATSAQYADLAEIYSADADYAPGTVVKIGGDVEITQTTEHADTEVFGVISTQPAYLMNSDASGLPVALQGRVPVRVIGKVKKGERLVSSDVPGVAWGVADEDAPLQAIIGRSLEDKTDGDEGIIEAVIGVK